MVAVVEPWLARLRGVTLSRLRGPVARKHTRWWFESKAVDASAYLAPAGPEYKAVDADYVLPARTVAELEDPLRAVGIRVAEDAARDTAAALGRRDDNPFALDTAAIEDAVSDAVEEMMGVARRHADEVRRAILDADASADSLDEVLDRVDEAYRRGGPWILMAGRTLATALRGDTTLRQARALGGTHAQWLSRRDGRVRPTHVRADGQVRALGDPYRVGLFDLRFPADPTDLPRSWPEVAECRCSLLPLPPDPTRRRALDTLAALRAAAPGGNGPGAPGAGETIAGYRPLTGDPEDHQVGTRIPLPAGTPFALSPPGAGALLVAAIPAALIASAEGAAVSLAGAATLEILAVTGEEVAARLVPADDEPPATAPTGSP